MKWYGLFIDEKLVEVKKCIYKPTYDEFNYMNPDNYLSMHDNEIIEVFEVNITKL